MPKNNFDFDQNHWVEVIKKPDWYFEFDKYIKAARQAFPEGSEGRGKIHKATRHFFEKALLENKVALATNGPNLDAQRKPIDTIVIHHTGHPNYRLNYMEATQLLNIYARYYANPTLAQERGLKGEPIWSNHFRDGRQTFLCYHWLMHLDGSFERLLDDDKIGWQAGDWDVNCRSVAICLDNDYEKQDPPAEILEKLAAHITKYYPEISKERIIGHREANPSTICPGENFLSGWKPKLLDLLSWLIF